MQKIYYRIYRFGRNSQWSQWTWQDCGQMEGILYRQQSRLQGSTIELFKSGEPGVPTVTRISGRINHRRACALASDGRSVRAREAETLEELLQRKTCHVFCRGRSDRRYLGDDRPALSCGAGYGAGYKVDAENRRACRIQEIGQGRLKEKEADIFVLTSLDDIAWLLNIRGNDIDCCPVVLSYW